MTASTPEETTESSMITGDQPAEDSSVIPDASLERVKPKIPGYQLLRRIGSGGQSVVYEANRESTGQRVAVKVLREGPLADEAARERQGREKVILASLNHPNIVGILDSGETEDGHDYLVMDYVAGEHLDKYIGKTEESANADPSALLRLFMKICDAVNVVHLHAITHRDLSPSNILIDDRGEPHIVDFGLARTPFDRFFTHKNRDISVDGQFLGKLAYASPEIAKCESDQIGIRTDVYALGVILYQILTGGQFPYEVVGNFADVLNNIVRVIPTPPSKLLDAKDAQDFEANRQIKKRHPPVVNETIEGIVLKALEKKPENRYQSAGELSRQIENYLSPKPTDPPQPTERIGTHESRPKAATRSQLAGTVLMTAFVMVTIWLCTRSAGPQPKLYSGDGEHHDVSTTQVENANLKLSRLLPVTRGFTNSIGMKFVRIEPGEFDTTRNGIELHRVVRDPFFMSETLVTQAQFYTVEKAIKNRCDKPGPDLPAYETGRREANSFCEDLTKIDRNKYLYRLPSEDQWEWAAQGSKPGAECPKDDGPLPVFTTETNHNGLYGMTRSVEQWCRDRKLDGPQVAEWPKGTICYVVKGGNWFDSPMLCAPDITHADSETAGHAFRICIVMNDD